MKIFNRDANTWLVLGIIAFLILDFTVFNEGLIFFIFLGAAFIYFGKRGGNKTFGRILIWTGIGFIILSILSSLTFQFILLALLVLAIYQFFKASKVPKNIEPLAAKDTYTTGEKITRKKSVLQNMLFGNQQTPTYVYEWDDIHIQTGFGNCHIDLSNTVFPDETAVVSIHGIAGNITIYVPYEVEVSVHYSAVSGTMSVFSHEKIKLLNETIHLQTEQYSQSQTKVKILTSMIVGNVEVKRI